MATRQNAPQSRSHIVELLRLPDVSLVGQQPIELIAVAEHVESRASDPSTVLVRQHQAIRRQRARRTRYEADRKSERGGPSYRSVWRRERLRSRHLSHRRSPQATPASLPLREVVSEKTRARASGRTLAPDEHARLHLRLVLDAMLRHQLGEASLVIADRFELRRRLDRLILYFLILLDLLRSTARGASRLRWRLLSSRRRRLGFGEVARFRFVA